MALKDKAGVGVNIGDSVTEADFSFGDGVVKSITVPCSDGSHNVGLKWDDPRVESADLLGERRQTGRQASIRDRGGARRRASGSAQWRCSLKWSSSTGAFNCSPTLSEMEYGRGRGHVRRL